MADERYYDRQGYARVRVDGRLVGEHRVVMARKLGRKLRPGEVVHHKNHVRDDNRIENLELKTNETHSREHSIERAPKWITLKCPECGRTFQKLPSKVRFALKKKKEIYCSRSCVGRVARRSQLVPVS